MCLELKPCKSPNRRGQVLAPEFAVGRPGCVRRARQRAQYPGQRFLPRKAQVFLPVRESRLAQGFSGWVQGQAWEEKK